MVREYPEVLPTESIGVLVRIIRSGDYAGNRAALGLHGWNVQGYLQKVTLGLPDDDGPLAATAELSADEVANRLESLVPVEGRPDALLDKLLLKQLLQFIMPLLLDKLFNK